MPVLPTDRPLRPHPRLARPRRGPAGAPGPQLLGRRDMERVRQAFGSLLPVDGRIEHHLRAVVADALSHPGSLARAQLAFGVGARLGGPAARAMKLAIAVEYFHTASLIFDDMPAMDDATVRRGRPCPHVVHGEGAAILGALALITRGYALAFECFADLPPRRRARANALLAECLGLSGILDGQARDLHFARSAASPADVERVAAAKTVPLLRLAIVLPALAAGAPASTRAALERLSAAWGLAYQVIDDFKDVLMTEVESGKTADRDDSLGRPNLPETAGVRRAMRSLDVQFEIARSALASLPRPAGPAWLPLRRLQSALDAGRAELSARLRTAPRLLAPARGDHGP